MKHCGYCGKDNEDQAVGCHGCGTTLSTQAPVSPAAALVAAVNWRPQSALGIALASGAGVVLLCTAIYFAVGGASFALLRALDRLPPIDAPEGSTTFAFFMFRPVGGILAVGAVVFAFLACRTRCRKKWHGIMTAVVAIGLLALFRLVPGVWWTALPALMLGFAGRSSAAFYIGAALQLVLAAWLLGWCSKETVQRETRTA